MRKDGNNAKNARNENHSSHASHPSPDPERLLPPRGDYQTLLSFKKAEVVYDFTLEKDFLEQGGLRERMTRVRLQRRNKSPE